jgi:hypothetical protein
MIPFILKGTTKVPPERGMPLGHVYDSQRQIWVDSRSGIPVVASAVGGASRYGETTLSETREGVDQTEVVSIHGSRFGETTLTKTMEGVDQGESAALAASRFGETTVTATQEGHDQSEVTAVQSFDVDAPHSHF